MVENLHHQKCLKEELLNFSKIHGSKPLLNMLKRMEMEPITPNIMLKRKLMLLYLKTY